MFIFIDHIPGNFLASLTLHKFGFSDAAEVFVALAGYAAFLAYYPSLESEGWRTVLNKVMLRVRDLYLAHVAVLIVCVVVLCGLAHLRENPLYLTRTWHRSSKRPRMLLRGR